MTRVDFYVIDEPSIDEHARLVCRLADKAWSAGHHVHIRCFDSASVDELDRLLWTFKDSAFVPHAPLEQADDAPVTIGSGDQVPVAADVLINLGDDVPNFFSRFERVMETTGVDEARRAAARERYRYYQERGYALSTHKVGRGNG